MTRKTLQRWIESYKGDNLACALTNLIEEEHQLIKERNRIDKMWQIFNEEKAKKEKELQQLERNVQGVCPHLETNFYPDPSGNNDSYSQCVLCRKIL